MKKYILILIIILLLPSISHAYPINDLVVREFPDKFVAGNTHHASFSFDNIHNKPVKVRFVLNISNINEYSELDMTAKLNGEPINITQTDPGRFSSNIISASVGNNIINGTLKTNIRLAPLTYEFTGLMYVENVSKPKEFEHEHDFTYYHGGGTIIDPGYYTQKGYTPLPTATPTATPSPTSTENIIKPTLTYLPVTPVKPTVNITKTPTPEEEEETPGFDAVFAIIGLTIMFYIVNRR